jgi:hypothetical protein
VEGAVLLPPQWAVFAVRGIKLELNTKTVSLRFSTCLAPVVDLGIPEADAIRRQESKRKNGLLIKLVYSSPEAFSLKEVRARYENFALLAALELNRMLGGEIAGRTSKTGIQEIDIWLPFHR